MTNLLLDRNGVLKLCDFGLARRCSGYGKPCTPTVTSLWYRAPEILLGDKCYGSAVDLWSFGCIFAEWLQHGEPLFQCRTESEMAPAPTRPNPSPKTYPSPNPNPTLTPTPAPTKPTPRQPPPKQRPLPQNEHELFSSLITRNSNTVSPLDLDARVDMRNLLPIG